MARIGKVFPDLIRDLEIKGALGPLSIGPEVFGVVLLDSLESFTASPRRSIRIGDWFTQGVTVAPAAGTVLADTGALATGIYDLSVIVHQNEAAGANFEFQWRNAGNTANLVAQRLRNDAGGSPLQFYLMLEIQTDNERFRVTNVAAGGAGVDYQAGILARSL